MHEVAVHCRVVASQVPLFIRGGCLDVDLKVAGTACVTCGSAVVWWKKTVVSLDVIVDVYV